MVTRRQSLKTIISALLLPVLDKSVYAHIGTPQKRVTDAACSTCATAAGLKSAFASVLDSAPILKYVAVPLAIANSQKLSTGGIPINYVSSAEGNLLFSQLDLQVDCVPAISVSRYYNSASNTDVGLGPGWSLGVLDDYISLSESSAQLISGTGEVAQFARDPSGGQWIPAYPGLTAHKPISVLDNGNLKEVVTSKEARTYLKSGANYLLASVDFGQLGQVSINRDGAGRISSVANAARGASIELQWSDDQNPRLASLRDNTGRTVTFSYNDGLLSSVTDATGATWLYTYQAGQLVNITDPEGASVLQTAYSGSRVSASQTIDGSMYFTYADGGVTTAVDGLGNSTTYTHNGHGQLIEAKSADGSVVTTIAYDSLQRVTAISSGSDVLRQFAYDSSGRLSSYTHGKRWKKWSYDENDLLINESDPAGSAAYTHDANGYLTQSTSARKHRNGSCKFESGLLTSIKNAKKSLELKYDNNGQLVAAISTKTGRYQYGRNALGWLVSEQLPNRYGSSCNRNARGQVTDWQDTTGNKISYQRDGRGAIVQVENASGEWARATRDSWGRIIGLTNSKAQTRNFSYDKLGRLANYTDALGQNFVVTYAAGSSRVQQMQQINGDLTIVRGSGGESIAVAGKTSAGYDDGWFDPLYSEGLLGSFSGFGSIVASKKVILDPVQSDIHELISGSGETGGGGDYGDYADYADGLGDDGGDTYSDSDAGADCADSPNTGSALVAAPEDGGNCQVKLKSTACYNCESAAYANCNSQYGVAWSQSLGAGIAIEVGCGVANLTPQGFLACAAAAGLVYLSGTAAAIYQAYTCDQSVDSITCYDQCKSAE